MKKVRVAILGSGNIGTDLLMKVQRSPILECAYFIGRNPESKTLKLARDMGVRTSAESIKAIQDDPESCEIVFDVTSAPAHKIHAPILKKLGKYTIDLTPAKIGDMCVPVLNMEESLNEQNVNLITCGGQAATPLITAIMKVHPETEYIELVSSVSSISAGGGTRENIDQYTQTTKDSIVKFSGVKNAKAIIILNPADPPVNMHNTIYALIPKPDLAAITKAVDDMAARIKEYVPGYRISLEPVEENGRVTLMNEVIGLGDYLPPCSGNLDIITCAAVKVAEEYAEKRLGVKRE